MIRSLNNLAALLRGSQREVALLGGAAAVLLFLTAFSFWLSQKALRDSENADELNRFNARLTEFVQMLRTVESSQRGYLIASSEEFLQPYNEMSSKLMPMAKDLAVTAPGYLTSAQKITAFLPDLADKLNEMEGTIAEAKGGNKDGMLARVKGGFGRRLTDHIEKEVRSIQAEEASLVHTNEANTRSWERLKAFSDAAGALVILSFSSMSLLLLMKSNAAMRDAQEALSNANLELEDMVEQRTGALKRANEEIQRFAYIVSHDLRSPLVNIMGFTSELETLRQGLFEKLARADALTDSDALSKDFDEAFGFIKSSIARMDRLINAILRISREGNRPLNPEAIMMNDLVGSLISGLMHQIRDSGVQVQVGSLPNVVTDRLAIEQIFSNLIENALKFLKPDQKGEIKVEGHELGNEVVFSISDNGRGIDPKDHNRIFELFRRSGPQNVPGEGMGLAFVTALVRRLGGRVDVYSSLGGGSTFKLSLPVKLRHEKRMAA